MRRVLAFICCFSALCLAQSPNSASTVSTILPQMQNAFSGGKAVTMVQMNGHASWHYGSDQQTGAATLVANANGSSSMTLNLSGGTRKESFAALSNDLTCDWTDKDGTVHPSPSHNCLIPSAWFLPAITTQASQTAIMVTDLGKEAEETGVVEHLQQQRVISARKASDKKFLDTLGKSDLMLDPQTFLPSVLKFNLHPDDNGNLDIPVEIHYSDYRQVSGVNIPFRIEKRINNNPVLVIDVDSATVN